MPAIKMITPPEQDTQTELRPLPNERDETQRHIDGRFGELVKMWHDAKTPAPDKSPFDRYTVPKTDVSALKTMIRSAARLHKHDVRFFKDAKDGNGNTTVKFVPVAKAAPKASAENEN